LGRSIICQLAMSPWVNRNQRHQRLLFIRPLIIILLSIIAVALILIKWLPQRYNYKNLVALVKNDNPINEPAEIEKFYQEIYNDLNLGKAQIKRQAGDYKGIRRHYPCYAGLYPKDYPFAWLMQKLNEKCQAFPDITCESMETNQGRELVTWLIRTTWQDTIAELNLAASGGMIPGVSSISFIFKNFSDFKQAEALDLIWLDIPFGFTLRPDQVPGDKLARALKSSKGQCILELPVNRDEWQVILHSHKLAGTIMAESLTYENTLSIMRVFPSTDAFFFSGGAASDHELIHTLINVAEARKMIYLYAGEKQADYDSLVFARGLKFRRLIDVTHGENITSDEFRDLILRQTVEFRKAHKGIYFIGSRSEHVQGISSLLPLLDKMNIKTSPPLRHTESIEKL
jgi:hypothetical protein